MFTSINERIAVIGVYACGVFLPKKMNWNRQEYRIDEITMKIDSKKSGLLTRIYSVRSGTQIFRLEFDCLQETWTLLEVWCE